MGVAINVTMQVTIHSREIDRLFRSREGPVGVKGRQLADRALQLSITKIGTHYSGHHAEDRPKLLRDSGRVVPGNDPDSPTWRIVFDHRAAWIHHYGSEEHVIAPTKIALYRDGPQPVDSAGNKVFYRKRAVKHPGYGGNPFVTDAAKEVGLRASGALKRGPAGPFPIFR